MSDYKLTAEPGKQAISGTRTFNAPRELVFKVMTDPTSIPQWWGPKGLTTIVDKMEIRPGGHWRYVQHDADGNEYAFHGVYHSIVSPAQIINTFEWESMPGHVILETVTLEEYEGKTKLTQLSVFQSVEDRDGMLQAGSEEGATETLDRLEELITARQAISNAG